MFIENQYARPLFDFEKGGPPKAFQCLMPHLVMSSTDSTKMVQCKCGLLCDKVTRTERGMMMHLKLVHDHEVQGCLYSTEVQSDQENGAPRKLRAGRPSFPSAEPAVEQRTEKILSSQKSHKTSGQELLPLTNEEK